MSVGLVRKHSTLVHDCSIGLRLFPPRCLFLAVRKWLIRLIAGKMPVCMNVTVVPYRKESDASVSVFPGPESGYAFTFSHNMRFARFGHPWSEPGSAVRQDV